MSDATPTRVDATPEAVKMIESLKEQNGDLLFHQSGGCCDGSAPMCYGRQEFMISDADVWLGMVAGDTPFYMSAAQFEYWEHTHLTLDIVPGRGAGFSLEGPTGMRFIIRSRLFNDEEWEALKQHPVQRGVTFSRALVP